MGAAFTLIIVLMHLPYLHLPLFWDEMGQFVPAALDLWREGLWVPRSTQPNVHPPGLPALLAAVWSLAGYSIPATRLAMLAMAGMTATATFMLAGRLCRGLPGAPAFSAVTLLIFSPLFYTQAMLAQLDLPAALFTVWALIEFLAGRCRRAALACTLLVLFKETGAVVPLVLGAWLWREGRKREAAWFAAPLAALGAWLAVLAAATGHWLGNPEFERYNVYYPLHPVRLVLALLRRFFFLCLDQFHFLGWMGILAAWRKRRLYAERSWRVVASVAAVQVLAVTLLGGATLERYLLPVLPLLYAAMAAGWSFYPAERRRWTVVAAVAGMVLCLFWSRPLPAPLENNLAMVRFVRLHQQAAQYLEQQAVGRVAATAWPLSEALRSPDFGYVRRGLRVRQIPDFGPSALAALNGRRFDVLVIYRRDWNPGPLYDWFPVLGRLRARYYGFEGETEPEQAARLLGLDISARFSEGPLWLAVLEKPESPGFRPR